MCTDISLIWRYSLHLECARCLYVNEGLSLTVCIDIYTLSDNLRCSAALPSLHMPATQQGGLCEASACTAATATAATATATAAVVSTGSASRRFSARLHLAATAGTWR
jgi:hypothetical protein